MDDLEKQLMDMSGMKEPEVPVVPPPPSVVEGTDSSALRKSRISPVRTFNTDLANAVREHGGSVVRVAIAEEEKHRRAYEESSITSKKNMAFVIGGILLVLAAIGGGIYAYQYNKAASVVVPVVTPIPESIIASDSSKTIDISGMQASDLFAAVQKIVMNPTIQSGEIENIILTRTVNGATIRPTASDFLKALGSHASEDFKLSLSKDYMLGAYLYNGQNNQFLVLRGTAHDFLLSGMIAWEPWLFDDLVPLFNINTTMFTKAQLQSMPFHDAVIGNRDARAVLGIDGKPMLYYSFIDPNTIFFATDPKTLTQAISKF